MRTRRAAFTCFNLARSRSRMVLRSTKNLPFFQDCPQMCVNPRTCFVKHVLGYVFSALMLPRAIFDTRMLDILKTADT